MIPKAILTDIEGTTSSLAYVKEVLFPFARARLADYVRAHAAELGDLLAQINAPDTAAAIAQLIAWSEADAKIGALKTLQGLIWAEGYAAGVLKGHIYPDAVAGLRRWHAAGVKLYVYSSGSAMAQRLLFGHSEAGDLTPLFSGHFDTAIGAKTAPASYAAIAQAIALVPADILFLSDSVAELDAARAAGLATMQLVREGEAPPATHPVITSFDDILADLPPTQTLSAESPA